MIDHAIPVEAMTAAAVAVGAALQIMALAHGAKMKEGKNALICTACAMASNATFYLIGALT